MNYKPYFSIILPTYNRVEQLRRALDSIKKQTFKDFEVIVCDDGSTDNTKEVVNSFLGLLNIKYINGEHWGGPARPRNNGIKAAQGEYVAFLDVDDWWYPNKLEYIKRYLSDGDVIYHDCSIYTPRGKKLFKEVKGRHLKKPVFVDLMKNGNALMTSGVVVRKSIIDKAGGMEEDKSLISVEDFDLWLKIAKVTEKFTYIPIKLGAYWIEEDNISSPSRDLIERTEELYRRHLNSLEHNDRKEAEMVLGYLAGRIKQRMGFLKEALQLFKISAHSKNIKFKLRSLCWITLIKLFLIIKYSKKRYYSLRNMKLQNLTFKGFINYFAIFVIFSDALVLKNFSLFDLKASYFILFIGFLLMLSFMRKIYFSKIFLILFLAISFSSLINVYLGNNNIIFLLKQSLGIIVSSLFFYSLIKFNNEDVKKLFKIYLRVAFVVGFIGIIQEIGYLLRIRPLFDFRYLFPNMNLSSVFYTTRFFRINSIMPEPASFCIAMSPAFFISLYSFFKNRFIFIGRWKCVIILLSYFFSLSITGYFGIFFTIILVFLNLLSMKKFILYCTIPFLFLLISTKVLYDLNNRFYGTIAVFMGRVRPEETNLSTFTLFNNTKVVSGVIKKSPIFGFGLGSHPVSFKKSIVFSMPVDTWMPLLNLKDANSLFLRILSEAGIFGLGVFLAFLIIFYIPKKRDKGDYLWIINNAILVFFIIRLIRQGNYFSEGFFFFFWLYYFTKKQQANENQLSTVD